MAKTKTRQFPRLEPCAIGKQIDAIIGDDRKLRAARRKSLAARLGVSDGYLQFLAVGEVTNDGKLMTPSTALAAKFRNVVEELGGIKKARVALDGANAPAATTAPATERAANPQTKPKRASKARTKAKSGAKTVKKAGSKRSGSRKGETTLRKLQRTRSLI